MLTTGLCSFCDPRNDSLLQHTKYVPIPVGVQGGNTPGRTVPSTCRAPHTETHNQKSGGSESFCVQRRRCCMDQDSRVWSLVGASAHQGDWVKTAKSTMYPSSNYLALSVQLHDLALFSRATGPLSRECSKFRPVAGCPAVWLRCPRTCPRSSAPAPGHRCEVQWSKSDDVTGG
jgi:hypothetical protein